VSQKRQDTNLLFITSLSIDRFLKFFHCYIQQKIAISLHLDGVAIRYTTLQNISFQKLYRPKAQQRQTRHDAHEENLTAVGKLVLSQ